MSITIELGCHGQRNTVVTMVEELPVRHLLNSMLNTIRVPAHTQIDTLQPLLLASLLAAWRDYTAPGEIKLTVLITWDDQVREISHMQVPVLYAST
eukprot:1196012-Prorocentrum_minimum.AAC.7